MISDIYWIPGSFALFNLSSTFSGKSSISSLFTAALGDRPLFVQSSHHSFHDLPLLIFIGHAYIGSGMSARLTTLAHSCVCAYVRRWGCLTRVVAPACNCLATRMARRDVRFAAYTGSGMSARPTTLPCVTVHGLSLPFLFLSHRPVLHSRISCFQKNQVFIINYSDVHFSFFHYRR